MPAFVLPTGKRQSDHTHLGTYLNGVRQNIRQFSLLCEAHEKLIKPLFAPISEIKDSLHIEGDNCQLVLCQEHYQELYRKFLGPSPCASCDIKPKKGTYFVRHSPNADLVNKILGTPNTEGTQPIIKADNKICSVSYKSHLAIIKSHEQDMI